MRSQSSGAASSVNSSAATGSNRTSSPGESYAIHLFISARMDLPTSHFALTSGEGVSSRLAGRPPSISASCLPPQPQGASVPKQSTGGADGNRSTASLLQQPLASGGPLPSSPFAAVIKPPPGMESNALSLGSTSTHPMGTRSSGENTTSHKATGAALAGESPHS